MNVLNSQNVLTTATCIVWTILIVLRHHQGEFFLLNAIRGYRGYSPKGLAVGTRSVGTRSRSVYIEFAVSPWPMVPFFWHMPSVVAVIAASSRA